MLRLIFYRWLLIAILLGMQYAALLHSVEHLFHQPELSCSIFTAVEHHSNGLIQDTFNFQLILNHQPIIFFSYTFIISFIFSSFQARAPPL